PDAELAGLEQVVEDGGAQRRDGAVALVLGVEQVVVRDDDVERVNLLRAEVLLLEPAGVDAHALLGEPELEARLVDVAHGAADIEDHLVAEALVLAGLALVADDGLAQPEALDPPVQG